MYPSDSGKAPEVTLEWDKNEKQRARNRINQRNYRRRKSEQQKGNDKQRAKSSSLSPAVTPASNAADLTHDESEASSQAESTSNPLQRTLPNGIWQMPTHTYPESFEARLAVSEDVMASESGLGRAWSASRAVPTASSSRNAGPQTHIGTWQNEDVFGESLDIRNFSSDISNMTWSEPPGTSLSSPELAQSGSASSRGRTTLHLAAEYGHSHCAQVLFLHGADPNMRDAEGYTALHIAATNGHKDFVTNLIDRGCDLNAITSSGRTALHLAAENGHSEVIDLLLRAGCDPNLQISGP